MSRFFAALVALLTLTACGSTPAPASAPAPVAPAAAADHGLARSVPTWVDVPRIAAKSTLVPLGLNADRTVEVPPVSKPLQAGWYRNSPTPGELGPAVILGHIDGNHEKGVFWRLHEVRVGDEVRVGRADGGALTFTVYKVDQIAKSSFPTDAVYGDTDRPELRLITCGGEFDAEAHSYVDNVLVFAALTP